MAIIYILLPLSLFFGICGLIAYLWSVRSGQFDDLETPAHRILFDDEPERKSAQQSAKNVHEEQS